MDNGLNKNLSPRKRVMNMFESWNVNGFRYSSDIQNLNKIISNDFPLTTSHLSHLDKKTNENNVRNLSKVTPRKLYTQMPPKLPRPSTCACINTIRSTASLPNRPSTANSCTRYHDKMLQALMRNVDKFCGNKTDSKEGNHEHPMRTLSHTTTQQEREKKREMFESQNVIDINDIVKSNRSKDSSEVLYKKNTKSTTNKRKKSKINVVKTVSKDPVDQLFHNDISSKALIKTQSTGLNVDNNQMKNGRNKDVLLSDDIDNTAWEINDFDQMKNISALVMPKETKHATLCLLHDKKLKEDRKLKSQNTILDSLSPGLKKPKKTFVTATFNS